VYWCRDVTRVLVPRLAMDVYYGVATISRLLKIIGLFCKRALLKRLYSAKETQDFKEPTNRSHPIRVPHVCVSSCASASCVCFYMCVCLPTLCVRERYVDVMCVRERGVVMMCVRDRDVDMVWVCV